MNDAVRALIGVVLALALSWAEFGCAHLAGDPGAAAVAEVAQNHRVYPLSEAELEGHVIEWFRASGVRLLPTPRAHFWSSTGKAPLPTGHTAQDDAEARSLELRELQQSSVDEFAERSEQRTPFSGRAMWTALRRPRLSESDTSKVMTNAVHWVVQFIPLGPKQTAMEVSRANLTEWDTSTETSRMIATAAFENGESIGRQDRMPPPQRDPATERLVAEALDFSAAVEVLGEADETAVDPDGGRLAMASEMEVDPLPDPAATTVAAPPDCGVLFDSSEGDFAPGHVVLLSDLQGTTAGPQAVGATACAVLKRGARVTLALSIDGSEQRRVNDFLESNGDEAARTALLKGAFWRRPWQDGRSSIAMFALIERLRQFRRSGAPVAVLTIDAGIAGNARASIITWKMLEHLRRTPDRVVIGYLSNTLTKRLVGAEWNATFDPVGHRLAVVGVPVHSYDVMYGPGRSWSCHLQDRGHLACGTWPVRLGPMQREWQGLYLSNTPRVQRFTTLSPEGFDGAFYIGTPDASPPAAPGHSRDDGEPTRR